ncbi:MAG: ROK family protein [Deltaproteobacteria bacterium]
MKEISLRSENLSERARKNLFILDAIRRRGPISKTDISNLIGLNVVTISNYIEDFLRQKVVFEKEYDVSKGGRRPLLLDLNASAGYAVGVGINLTNTIGVVTDLSGRILHKVTRNRPDGAAKDVIDALLETLASLLEMAGSMRGRIRGVGIGIGGIVDSAREKVRWPEKLDDGVHYADVTVPLKDIIEREFRFPVKIDNDATLACFGEQWLALESGVRDLLFMFSGVGCGIMLNNEIYEGATGCAGEISIHSDKKEAPYFLERWEADLGIRKEYLKRLGFKNGLKKGSAADPAAEVTLTDIFEKARAGEELAVQVVREAGRQLGMRAAYLVNLLNPEMVVIGGGIEQAGIALIEEVKGAVSEWCFEEAAGAVKIVPSRLGEDAVALGAASLIIRHVFSEINE